ncbi:MAG: hypothetical protein MJ095_06760 [Oscillospiraceae bacterium]|nr:hypothetical protein [Oscillospiraceae bacterium]
MKGDAGKTAVRISVPAVIILAALKIVSVMINGTQENSEPEVVIHDSVLTQAVTGAEQTEPAAVSETEAYVLTETSEPDEYTSVEVSAGEPAVTDLSDEIQSSEYSEYTEYRFRNSKLLSDHYKKHGVEMGFDSAESYEQAASDVINSPEALHKKEKEDNDEVYYIEETNEFAVLSSDGYLRTYFYPDRGKAYYDRQ